MFCAEIMERTFISFHFFKYLSNYQNLKQTGLWVIYLLIEYRIKMRLHRLIHDRNKPVPNLYVRFEFSSVNSIILCAHHLLPD